MKKFISILLLVSMILSLGSPVFAGINDINDITSIEIKPRHTDKFTGENAYYGRIYTREDFSRDTLNYTAVADYEVANIRIDTTFRGNCTVDGNKEYVLNVGENIINITVTQPGNIIKIYTIKIIRKQNPVDDNNLTSLSLVTTDNTNRQARLTPSFNPFITSYKTNVPNAIREIRVSCGDPDGIPIGGVHPLKTGENIIEIPVISESGLKKVYTININREKSSVNAFSFLDIEEYDSKKVKIYSEVVGFNDDPTKLVKDVSYDVASINMKVAYISDYPIQVTGSGFYDLKVGPNKINFTAVAENGAAKAYTLTINRAKPSAELDSLQINQYICGTNEKVFTLDVNYTTTKANIKGIAENRSATITGNGEFNLKVGANKYTITVKAADGTIKKFPIVINRLKQSTVKVFVIWTIVK
jgi:hypothetical protein